MEFLRRLAPCEMSLCRVDVGPSLLHLECWLIRIFCLCMLLVNILHTGRAVCNDILDFSARLLARWSICTVPRHSAT